MKILFFVLGMFIGFAADSQFSTGVSAYYGRSIVVTNQVAYREGESYVTEFGNNFLGGIYLNYDVTDWFALQMDLLYDQLNTFEGYYKVAYEEDVITPLPYPVTWPIRWFEEEQWIRMDYLSIPFSLKVKLKKWNFKLGVQYAYLAKIGRSVHHYSYYFNYDYGTDFEYADGFYVNTRHNLGGVISCGYNLFKNLSLEVRYVHGFANLSQDYIDHDSWSRQLNFGLSYQILPKKSRIKK